MESTQASAKRCRVENCKRPYKAKGWCNVHYKKWRRGEMSKKPYYKICGEENCRAPSFRHGMCEKHYEAWSASKKGEDKGPEAATPAVPAPEKPSE